MSVQITIRNVPERVRDELAARAEQAHLSLHEYLLGELERIAAKPSLAPWLDGIRERKAASPRELAAERLLEHRDADRR
jgi:antitoxin FitA